MLNYRYLKLALTDKIRIQDVRYVFQSVYSNNGNEGVDDTLEFLKNNYQDFETQWVKLSSKISFLSKQISALELSPLSLLWDPF